MDVRSIISLKLQRCTHRGCHAVPMWYAWTVPQLSDSQMLPESLTQRTRGWGRLRIPHPRILWRPLNARPSERPASVDRDSGVPKKSTSNYITGAKPEFVALLRAWSHPSALANHLPADSTQATSSGSKNHSSSTRAFKGTVCNVTAVRSATCESTRMPSGR